MWYATILSERKKERRDTMTTTTIEKPVNLLNRFIEATAVMIVTTCLIPLLVIVFFVWIVKTLFNVQIILPASLPKPKRHKKLHGDGNELALTE